MATITIKTETDGYITCKNTTLGKIMKKIRRRDKNGDVWLCCDEQCVRIDNIDTVVVVNSKTSPETGDDDYCRNISIVRPNRITINYWAQRTGCEGKQEYFEIQFVK